MCFRPFVLALVLGLSSTATVKAADLRSDIAVFAARFGWPGAVALELDRTSVLKAVTYGVCRDGEPLTLDTPLLIGSVSKAFTAQGALTLAERGRLDLDEPIGPYVPGLTVTTDRLTPRQLLTHTSGFTARQGMSVSREAQLGSLNPGASPGRSRYSNLNYNLLGAVISRRAGAAYSEALRELVAARFGLDSVSVGSDRARACGHTLAFGAVIHRAEPRWPSLVAPAGFLQASANDLARLEWALLADPRSGRGGPLDPLTGWKRAVIGRDQVFSHSGQIGGARATVVVMPERGRGLVFLVNRGGDVLQDPVDDLAHRAVSRALQMQEEPVPWPWERGVRFGALAALIAEAARFVHARHRRPQRPISLSIAVVAATAAIAVPAIVLYATGLTAAALWRLTPDLGILLGLGPSLAAARWAVMRTGAASRPAAPVLGVDGDPRRRRR